MKCADEKAGRILRHGSPGGAAAPACGLVSVSFRQLSPERIVQEAKRAGLSCIEWGSDCHAVPNDGDRLKSIVALCDANAVSICSYGTYFRIGQSRIEELDGYIQAAKLLKTDVLRLWCGTKGYRDYTQVEWEALVLECRRIARRAEESDVTVCMECHNDSVTDTLEGALRLMREVDSEHFRMYWQPNQYRSVEENLRYAGQIAPYVKGIHVFNWDAERRYPLSAAKEVWKQYLNRFDGVKFLLLEFMPDDSVERLADEAKALYEIAGECL